MFARRQRRTLGVDRAQRDDAGRRRPTPTATGSTSRPRIRTCGCSSRTTTAAHFYNWPYTYGLLFGLGLFAKYRDDPERFRAGYDDLLSRAGMDTAEELGAAFGIDVTDEAFWTASLDVLRGRIDRVRARWPREPEVLVIATALRRSTATQLAALLAGEPRYRVDQVWQGLYEQPRRRPAEMTQPAARRCAPGSTPSCRRR